MVVVEWVQDDQDNVLEDLENYFDVVEVVEDDIVLVEGLEDDFDVVEVVEDEVALVNLLEDGVHDADVQDEVPEAGREVQSCIDVLHDVMVDNLGLQDEKVVLGHVHIEEQDVEVEDEDVDESLEETLDELAHLRWMKKCD